MQHARKLSNAHELSVPELKQKDILEEIGCGRGQDIKTQVNKQYGRARI